MSGLEVVGVVLGGIPLIISALEHYAGGVATIKNMIQYETVFLDIQVGLTNASATLRQTVEEVLRGIRLPDAQYRDLVEYQVGWDSEDLETKLRDRLQRDFNVFMASMKRLGARMKILANKLKLTEGTLKPQFEVNGAVDGDLRSKFLKKLTSKNPSWARIKFGFGADEQMKLVDKIAIDVKRLNHLVCKALNLQDERQERSSLSNSCYWAAIRSHAQRIHRSLQAIWPQKCSAHHHQVTLHLNMANNEKEDKEMPEFSLFFSLTDEQGDLQLEAREVTVLSLEAPSLLKPKTAESSEHKKPKRVAFASDTNPHGTESQKPCTSVLEVEDLCGSLRLACQRTQCLGFLPQQQWHYHLHDVRCPEQPHKLVPLREALKARQLRPRERCTWALSMASAVLQLYETPWLSQSWSLDDVYIREGRSPQLFITQIFGRFPTAETPADSAMGQVCLIKNPTVFALGVALLELSYGQDISEFRRPGDLDTNSLEHPLTQFLIADRLTKEVQENETPKFAEAVGKCIWPASDSYEFNLSSEGYRRRFYQDVVLKLKEEHDYIAGKAAPQHTRG